MTPRDIAFRQPGFAIDHDLGLHKDRPVFDCSKCAAGMLGRMRTAKKAASSRANGSKGGRPRKPKEVQP